MTAMRRAADPGIARPAAGQRVMRPPVRSRPPVPPSRFPVIRP